MKVSGGSDKRFLSTDCSALLLPTDFAFCKNIEWMNLIFVQNIAEVFQTTPEDSENIPVKIPLGCRKSFKTSKKLQNISKALKEIGIYYGANNNMISTINLV